MSFNYMNSRRALLYPFYGERQTEAGQGERAQGGGDEDNTWETTCALGPLTFLISRQSPEEGCGPSGLDGSPWLPAGRGHSTSSRTYAVFSPKPLFLIAETNPGFNPALPLTDRMTLRA